MQLQSYSRPGHCPNCGSWLGKTAIVQETDPSTGSSAREKAGRMIGEMLALPQLPQRNDGENPVQRNLALCVSAVTDGRFRAFSEVCGITLPALRSYSMGLPHLEMLVKIAASLGVSLASFFEAESELRFWKEVAERVKPKICQDLKLSHEEIKGLLRNSLSEVPPPRLCDVAKRHGLNLTTIRGIDGVVCKQIHKRFRESVRTGDQVWRRPGGVMKKGELEESLRAALAKENPDSLADIAIRAGYSGSPAIRHHFPDLCRQISAKSKAFRERQLKEEHEALTRMLSEERVLDLKGAAMRLGYKRDDAIKDNHPELCALILERQKQRRADYLAVTSVRIEEMLERQSLTFDEVKEATGVSRNSLRRNFPLLYPRVAERHWEAVRRTRTEDIQKADKAVRSAFHQLAATGAEPSLTNVMEIIPKGPYLWIKNVRLLLRKIRYEAETDGAEGKRSS
jgi:hypothetical protein